MAKIRVALAVLLLLVGTLFVGWGCWVLPPRNLLMLGPLGLAALSAAYGLVRGRAWGRWSALAIGVSGLWFLGSGILLFGARLEPLLVAGPFGLLTLCLLGRPTSTRFEADPKGGCPLRSRGPRVRLLRWGAIFSLSAVPALWLGVVGEDYATDLAKSPSGHILSALAIVTVLTGTALLFRQRLVGALLIALAIIPGAWLVVDSLVTPPHRFYDVFCAGNFGLAVVGPALVLAAVAGPALRVLRG